MQHAHRLILLVVPLALVAACAAEEQRLPPPGSPAPGQWTPQPQQGAAPWGQAPLPQQQPVQPGPGQWVPPAPPQAPVPWGPQGGWPLPNLGSIPAVPSLPGLPPMVPGMPGGASQQCVDTINQHRATQRLPPLGRWIQAEPCAAGEAQSDAEAGQAHRSFGRCGEAAQNVCPGWQGPAEKMTGSCLQSMWNEGPGADFGAHGHYLNMSNTRYTRVACGYFAAGDGSVWAVQDFQ